MKVLVLSFCDFNSWCSKIARAIDEHQDHEAKSAIWNKDNTEYPYSSIWRPDKNQTIDFIKWSDAIIIIGQWQGLQKDMLWGTQYIIPPKSPSRPIVVNYMDNLHHDDAYEYSQYGQSYGVIQSSSFIDLLVYEQCEHWLPVPIWKDELSSYRKLHTSGNPFRVAQVATVRQQFGMNNTRQIIDKLSDVDGIFLDIITDVHNQEVLIRMGQADLGIATFKNGLDNVGLEFLAMGIPIVANGFDELIKAYKRIIGYLPFIRCRVSNIKDCVIAIRDNPDLYHDALRRGTAYLSRFHDPQKVAEKAIKLCQMGNPVKFW